MSRTKVGVLLGLVIVIGLATACGSSSDCDCDPSQVQNAELNVGDEAPDFRLPDHRGGYVRLSDYKDKSNVIIAFYPAAFTPV
jgi:cytochrome oxidase Cu insertion factor (SCO1/SenC/PrrC family)